MVAEAQTLSTYNADTLLIGQLVSDGVSSSLAADVVSSKELANCFCLSKQLYYL